MPQSPLSRNNTLRSRTDLIGCVPPVRQAQLAGRRFHVCGTAGEASARAWTEEAGLSDAAILPHIEKVRRWGKAWHDVLRRGFDGGGDLAEQRAHTVAIDARNPHGEDGNVRIRITLLKQCVCRG